MPIMLSRWAAIQRAIRLFLPENPDNLVIDGGDFPYPPKTEDVHHEIELVVALKTGGSDIPVETALDHVYGYAVGIDMTRRDLQAVAKRPDARGKLRKLSSIPLPVLPSHPYQTSVIRNQRQSHLKSMVSSVRQAISTR